MYRVYVAVVSLAAADHLSPKDVALEFKSMLDDLECEQIRPLELLGVSKLEYRVGLAFDGRTKAEATE